MNTNAKQAAHAAILAATMLCAACSSQAVRPPLPSSPRLAVPTATPVSPTERLKRANHDIQVWTAGGTVRWVRPGQDIQERGFVWRESSGAWAVGVHEGNDSDATDADNGQGENGQENNDHDQGNDGEAHSGEPSQEGADQGTPADGAKHTEEKPPQTSPAGSDPKVTTEESPLAGAMASDRGVFLVHANGQADPIADDAMTARIHALWGDIPVTQLRAWVLALPSDAADAFTYYPNGLPSGLTPKEGHGWTVMYRNWFDAKPPMPQNVLLKGPDGTEVELRFDYMAVRQPLAAPPGLSF